MIVDHVSELPAFRYKKELRHFPTRFVVEAIYCERCDHRSEAHWLKWHPTKFIQMCHACPQGEGCNDDNGLGDTQSSDDRGGDGREAGEGQGLPPSAA